jgi:Tfp pilus assembly protein PilX
MPRLDSVKARASERGIVLISAILFVLLAAVLAAGYMATATGERSISSNTHVARGALYSADAGVRIAQQDLSTKAQAKLDSLVIAHILGGGLGPVIPQPNSVFPNGTTTVASTNPPFTASWRVAFSDSTLEDTAQVYNYRYEITSQGTRGAVGMRRVRSDGILRVSASRGTFADYLMFTHIHTLSSGGAIWFTSDGHFDGRVHTNGIARYAYNPTFEDLVTSVDNEAWFYNAGSNLKRNWDSNPPRDIPNYYGGTQRGAAVIPLPTNSFSQQNAALGLGGTSAPSNATINTVLGTGAGSGTPPNGIYIPNSGGTVTGGLYIQGDLSQCTMSIDSLGRQIYTMTQGGTTKSVAVDRNLNQTLLTVGGVTTIYAGVPNPLLYCNGQLSGLGGPARVGGVPNPGIANGEQLLITATGDIVLTNDITLYDYDHGNSVLGIYSSGGNVRVGTSAPNDMYLDAYVMATGAAGEFTVDNWNSGSPRGTFHLRGGMVSTYYGAFYRFNSDGSLRSGYARSFNYDRRGLVPPYYPTTPLFSADAPSARAVVWKEL